ncbi:MAG: hypothetical protein ACI87N_002141 [Flavobacteriales bacterium]|jgi:hypothetical protein
MSHSGQWVSENFYLDRQIPLVVKKGAMKKKIYGTDSSV